MSASRTAASTRVAELSTADLDEAYRQMRSRLRAFIAARVEDPETAEDLTQEVLLRLVRAGSAVDDPTAWLFRVARNAIIDHYRARRPHRGDRTMPAADGVVDPFAADPDGDRYELARCLRSLVDRLPEPYRSAVRAVDLEGATHIVVSGETGLSVSGVKSRVQRGRRQLRDLLLDCCIPQVSAGGSVIDYTAPARCSSPCAG